MENLKGRGFSIVKVEVKHQTAPCKPGGEVNSIDDDTKEAVCKCPLNLEGCPVDGRNFIIQDRFVVVFES